MAQKQTMKQLFDGFGQLYCGLEREIASRLETLSSRQLRRARDKCVSFTTTNCGYGIYRVARIVRGEAAEILSRRRSKKEDPS